MAITLDGLDLPADLEWQDEFDWQPIAHSSERSLTGKMLIEELPRQTNARHLAAG